MPYMLRSRAIVLLAISMGFARGAHCDDAASTRPPANPTTTVVLVPGSHLDLGFMTPLSEVAKKRIRILDQAIDAAEADPEFVWFEESGWVVEQWLDHYRDDPARIGRLRRLVTGERIGIGATMLEGYAAALPEGLGLMTMHLDRVEQVLGRRPDVAVVNDMPSVNASFRDALSDAGITRLLLAPNLVFSDPAQSKLPHAAFRWVSGTGRFVDVHRDPDGPNAGFAVWGLPARCAQAFEPERFGVASEPDAVYLRGLREVGKRLAPPPQRTVVEHMFDNWDTTCARELPNAVARWNALSPDIRIELDQPSRYFDGLPPLPELRGDWAAEWDLIRASEPVWTWRLRNAMRRATAATSHDARMALVEAMEHNVGLGPRWQPGLSLHDARRHVADVAAVYAKATSAMLGPQGIRAIPPRLAIPAGHEWPAIWVRYLGPARDAVRVRAGNSPLQPMLEPGDARFDTPLQVGADGRHIVASATVDRIAAEQILGARYRVVMEFAIRQPMDALRLSPADSDDASHFGWLPGLAPKVFVSPRGAILRGVDGLALLASSPLVIAWGLQPDPRDRNTTWLQALLVTNATHADVGFQPVRLPFRELYPGEPAKPAMDVSLELIDSGNSTPD